jgi:EAL domain-containing protein (putative c-di-GMP-specific phosphodiesterase class I)
VSRIRARDDPAEIMHTIVAMARSLKMGVTAVGVETIEQLERARTLGCNRAQGHYIAEPMDTPGAEHFLRQHRR